jgi:predicted GIY-YIG superfamily endonuclease
MNEKFKELVESLDPIYRRLMAMKPAKIGDLPEEVPSAGIYLFSEKEQALYVGRSNRIKGRLQEHSRDSSTHNSAPFAFRISREDTQKLKPSYISNGSRAALEKDTAFKDAFLRAKRRVRAMDVRFVEERDPLRQCLLEIYVAVATGAKYNDFDTH